jgi:hypothetical protein
MILVAGVFNLIDGLVGLYRVNYFESVTGGQVQLPVTDDIQAWSWVAVIAGVVLVFAGFGIFTGSLWARVIGVAAASLNLILQFAYVAHYPLWSLAMMIVDGFVIYALAVHGGPDMAYATAAPAAGERGPVDLPAPA